MSIYILIADYVVDVGGAHGERRKWIRCFADVKAVIFVAALNGYNMTLFEDCTTVSLLLSLVMVITLLQNQLEESLNLFQAICNDKIFVHISIVAI